MIYVPVNPPPPPSPRTLELAGLLGRVIQEYEKHHPNVTQQEVRSAIHLAAGASRKGGGVAPRVAAAAAGAVGLAVGAFVWMATSGGTGSGGSVPMVAASVGVLLVTLLMVVVVRGRQP